MVSLSTSLVERDGDLRELERALADSRVSGSMVLVSGEAGFGKTSLLKEFASTLDHRFQVLYGTCDAVDAAAAFAPLYELLHALPPDLSDHVSTGAERQLVYAGMLDLIKGERIVLILEDVHWADEATLGLIRYLGRRIDGTNSLLIVSYRREELDPAHPLQLVIADAGASATRIELSPLTVDGVRQLAEGTDVAVDALHAATLGNPFFVDQVLRHPEAAVPHSVGDAVLASARQLPAEAMELLELVAISPEGLDIDIVTGLISDAEEYIDLASQRRLVEIQGDRVRCRHELIRISLEQAIPPARKRTLHARLLGSLEQRWIGKLETARLAHHSVQSGNGAKAIQYSLEAARDAVAAGAHRHAAVHYSNALSFKHLMDVPTLDEVLLATAREQCLLNDLNATSTAQERVGLLHDDRDRAAAQAWVGFFASRADDVNLALRSAEEAILSLQSFPPSEGLAVALAVQAKALMSQGRWDAAIRSAEEAMAVAQAAGVVDMYTEAAITYGTVLWLLGDQSGIDVIDRASVIAVDAQCHEPAARALNNPGVLLLWEMRLPEARVRLEKALDYAIAKELDAWYIALLTSRAQINVMEGRFTEAAEDLERAVGHRTCSSTQCEGVIARATLFGRRGDSDTEYAVHDALVMTDAIGMYSEHVLATSLALEAAWLGLVDRREALGRYEAVKRLAPFADDPWARARVGFWAIRLGADPPAGPLPGPVGLESEGDLVAAAGMWEKMGFPVEAAITRAAVGDAPLEATFTQLDAIGADGVAAALRRHLREQGVRGVPRGERRSTRENPAGLTRRQAEVLTLLAEGMTNAAIAQHLFISEKTASHHVSAILRKLGVDNRGQAIAWAVSTGRALN
jgi:DNA-binding CsgD family transcriptional regulator